MLINLLSVSRTDKINSLFFWSIFLAAVLGVLVSAILVPFFRQLRVNKIKEYIRQTSCRYHQLLKINERFVFYDLSSSYCLKHARCSTKSKYDHFDYDQALDDFLSVKKGYCEDVIQTVKENQRMMKEYQSELQKLPDYGTINEDLGKSRISLEKYMEQEIHLCSQIELHPVCEVCFTVEASYSSPQGRNFYHNDKAYSVNDILLHEQSIAKRQAWQSTREYQMNEERRRMTPTLRYKILSRDHYRCVICGRSAKEDGVKLHVDHIIPVSKGGKTVPENLQTLCEDCNFGKSDKVFV